MEKSGWASSKSVGDDVIAMQDSQIFIVGDLILDSYVRGKVTRISPEAPVPVVLEQSHWAVLGGAANVAANIATFGATAVLAGRVGRDGDGERFLNLCKELGIDTAAVLQNDQVRTTRKLRVMAGYQQMLRVDSESTDEITAGEQELILNQFKDFAKRQGAKALVVSDYGKGVCTTSLLSDLIKTANCAKIPVVTDPKSVDMKRYAGTDIMKPNLGEGREMLRIKHPSAKFKTDADEIDAVCEVVLEGASARNVVLSLSEKGVVARGKDLEAPQAFSSTALQVADVSGAGDTMIAFLAMGYASALGLPRAVRLANIAAGIVCAKLGTAAVNASEFMEVFKEQSEDTAPEKIIERAELADILDQARNSGKKVVFTNGCFDLLHAGHIEILQKSKTFGDILVVALNSDASVKRLKGSKRPVQRENDRARIMASLACVDYVVLFHEDTPLELIQSLKPQILVKGGDYTEDAIVGAVDVKSWGGRVEVVPLVLGRSTTSIIERSK